MTNKTTTFAPHSDSYLLRAAARILANGHHYLNPTIVVQHQDDDGDTTYSDPLSADNLRELAGYLDALENKTGLAAYQTEWEIFHEINYYQALKGLHLIYEDVALTVVQLIRKGDSVKVEWKQEGGVVSEAKITTERGAGVTTSSPELAQFIKKAYQSYQEMMARS